MIKKKFKLNTSDFKEVFNFGKTTRTDFSVVKYKKNNLPYSRFAVVVSKKIHKKAHERNHLKRRYFAAIKEVGSQLSIQDYIFILNSSAKDVQYKDILSKIKDITL